VIIDTLSLRGSPQDRALSASHVIRMLISSMRNPRRRWLTKSVKNCPTVGLSTRSLLFRRPRDMFCSMGDLTILLEQIDAGDQLAAAELLPLVYSELRKLAVARIAQELPGQTLQATALVHEAYVRLVDQERVQKWQSRGHFFAAAAEAMRRILVEQARRKRSLQHGGGRQRVQLECVAAHEAASSQLDILDLDEALNRLAEVAPEKAALVNLRFFAGLSIEESATALGISISKAKRHWAFARAWLYGELNGNEE
jgi:RNA polymerase sigma factor (TIGR02999 family)